MKIYENTETINIPEGFETLSKPFQDFILQILKRLTQIEEANKVLRAEIVVLKAENINLQVDNTTLKADNANLKAENEILKARLSNNSSNSNKPPSTDQYERKSKPKSEREKTGKKTGGQPCHQGKTLQQTDNPDLIKNYNVGACISCQHDLSDVHITGYVKQQECDIPPINSVITEHRMAIKVCPKCKSLNRAVGPKHLTQPIQYGPKINALATYFHYVQLVPLQRIQEMFSDIFSLPISQGTLVNMHEQAYIQLEEATLKIWKNLQQGDVAFFDETSVYVMGKTQWSHVASNEINTAYFIHPKRGKEAIDAMNILPQFKGNAVHDHWAPYFTYDHCEHSLCNAHHARELRGIYENYNHQWAQQMREHLYGIKKMVDECKKAGSTALPAELLKKYSDEYDSILQAAQSQIPETKPSKEPKKRGRIKQHPAKNLHDRLMRRKPETLRFMHDFRVPFTNNQAERDIRMTKLKQKISGTFRSAEGADRFCRIRGYISTARKREVNALWALENVTRGGPESLFA